MIGVGELEKGLMFPILKISDYLLYICFMEDILSDSNGNTSGVAVRRFKTKHGGNFWNGFAKQTVDFHYALGELIDNSLSAKKVHRGQRIPAFIELSLEEMSDGRILIHVADEGIGVSIDEIDNENNIFNVGYTQSSPGAMNEHGFGLKNALALLTSGFENNFVFITKQTGSDFWKVEGCIEEDMSALVSSVDDWNEGLTHLVDVDSGVKVSVYTKKEYFRSVYPRASNFDTLIERLGEHLGVMYHRYISNGDKIKIRYKAVGASVWSDREIPAIPVPFLVNNHVSTKNHAFVLRSKGQDYNVEYIVGILDSSIKETSAQQTRGWPYPLKIHYQGSNARCGAALTVRNRVLRTGIFGKLWPKKAGDVSFNNFLAEISVGSDFPTTNNKTGLDPHTELWALLREKLSDDHLQPEKTTKKQSEESFRKKVVDAIAVVCNLSGRNKPSKFKVWDGNTEIDVYYELNSEHHIIETKINPSKILDVYQLRMYWDGIVKEKSVSPTSAILIAESHPPYVLQAISIINTMEDALGNKYDITTRVMSQYP